MPLPELWLARHGETAWTITRQHTGSTDIPLTERGERQARALGRLLAGIDFARVVSSPLARAAETARLAGFEAPERDERLREWDYGAYEGRTTADIVEKRPGWDLWRDGCPRGERAEDVADRLEPLLAGLRDAGGRILLFGHGHTLRVLAATWVRLGPCAGAALQLGTASLSVLGEEHERPTVVRWNLTADSVV